MFGSCRLHQRCSFKNINLLTRMEIPQTCCNHKKYPVPLDQRLSLLTCFDHERGFACELVIKTFMYLHGIGSLLVFWVPVAWTLTLPGQHEVDGSTYHTLIPISGPKQKPTKHGQAQTLRANMNASIRPPLRSVYLRSLSWRRGLNNTQHTPTVKKSH